MNTVITIGRQYGSGGRDVGQKLAEDYGIKLYDNEMLDRAAKESGICQSLFEAHDERPTGSFLFSLVMDTYSLGYSGGFSDMPLNHKVFLAQFEAIKKIAAEGPCVLVGRCADYALEGQSNVLKVFIHAPAEFRMKRIAAAYDLTDAKAKDQMQKTDKQRSSYYNYFTNKKWAEAASYDICLNSAVLGIDGCVKSIKSIIDLMESNREKDKSE
ncbi:MAG: cytidylate kinase-like family protein [Lachnospiraceae bacterium]|jgi:cytidylate kinase|nr:cytidylate kinase-like family protein [Lachnospiraceae bacterium]